MTLDELADEYAETRSEKVARNLKNKIAEQAERYIFKIMSHINTPKDPEYSRDDLRQEAMFMVFKSLENYDVSSDNKFSTYMYIRVRGRIIQYLRKHDVLSRTQRNRVGIIREASHQIEQEKGHLPNVAELAETTGMDKQEVREVLQDDGRRNMCYIYSSPGTASGNHGGQESRPPENYASKRATKTFQYVKPDKPNKLADDREELLCKMQILTVKQRTVLILYYFFDMTGREIATFMGYSLVYIYRLKKKGLKSLSKIVNKQPKRNGK